MTDLTDWLLSDDGPIAEDEAWARATCGRDDGPPPEGGEHWRWECTHDDTPVTPDPAEGEFLECPHCGGCSFGLRSIETYPTRSVGLLPTFVASNVQEIGPAAAGHLARWDPSRVLSECTAKRRIIAGEQAAARAYPEYADELWRWPSTVALAQVYAGREGWREEWEA